MSEAKQELVQQARFALKAERYDDMAATMKKVVEMSRVLSNEEQDLLSVAYKRVACARLSAWSIIRSIEQMSQGSEKKQQLAKEYREKVEKELREICDDVLGLLENSLLPNAVTAKSQMFYRMLKLDFSAYLAEITPGEGMCAKTSSPLLMTLPQHSPPGNAKLGDIEASLPLPITNAAPINNLADADLTAIFKHLPPYERLIVSEVSCRWRDLSQKAWLDVTILDLSGVPGPNIAAVLRHCPKLQSVTAVGGRYDAKYLHSLARLNLSSVKLYDCTSVIPDTRDVISDAYSAALSANLQSAAWDELVLHRFAVSRTMRDKMDFTASFPRSLRRLQLSGSFFWEGWMMLLNRDGRAAFLQGLEQLQQLECLVLLADHELGQRILTHERTSLLPMLSRLHNLRELYVGPLEMVLGFRADYTLLPANLPRLEVLFLHKPGVEIVRNFMAGIPSLRTLRILVITGHITDLITNIACPARKRFPNGFGADPLPLLHVFLGKTTRREIYFAANSDAMKVVEIEGRLTEFLERADIAPTFADVWIAEKIQEIAKRGVSKWDNDEY